MNKKYLWYENTNPNTVVLRRFTKTDSPSERREMVQTAVKHHRETNGSKPIAIPVEYDGVKA